MKKLIILFLSLFIIGCNENKSTNEYTFLERSAFNSLEATDFCEKYSWKLASKEQIQDFYDSPQKIVNNKLILLEENPEFIFRGLNNGSFTSFKDFGIYYPKDKRVDNSTDRLVEYTIDDKNKPYLLCIKGK